MPRCLSVVLAALALSCVLLAGCSDGNTALTAGGLKVRTVDVVMTEMRFTPSTVKVKAGETVALRFTNRGTVRHEAVIGDQAAQDQAIAMMVQMGQVPATASTLATGPGRRRSAPAHPGMSLPNVISLDPGQSGDITLTFGMVGPLLIQCHEPGHLEKGMTATLLVEPA